METICHRDKNFNGCCGLKNYPKGRVEALNSDNLGAKKWVAAGIVKENVFGSGTLSGEFIGKNTQPKTGNVNLIGGSWNPNGTPYKITDTIIHKVNTVITAEAVNNNLRGA